MSNKKMINTRRTIKLFCFLFGLLVYLTGFFPTMVYAFSADMYCNFEDLKEHESPDHYNIYTRSADSNILILAPHGGGIEGGTSELARELSKKYSVFLFEGLKNDCNENLHVTSENFDEPAAVKMAAKHDNVISLHGYADARQHILIGGTDEKRAVKLAELFNKRGFSAEAISRNHRFGGHEADNIANRNKSGKSIQIEISLALRESMFDHFTVDGREHSKNKTFYQFTESLSDFIAENY
ncbi:poly-gamma-glutamate hydrolase family protein [Bacillus atrophaeus]|nr:poly-gamma-glutamate hydrolase family protein [Bacillus atrophaeus]